MLTRHGARAMTMAREECCPLRYIYRCRTPMHAAGVVVAAARAIRARTAAGVRTSSSNACRATFMARQARRHKNTVQAMSLKTERNSEAKEGTRRRRKGVANAQEKENATAAYRRTVMVSREVPFQRNATPRQKR